MIEEQAIYLTPQQVCDRYNDRVKVRTLANWRASGTGPPFTKLGGAIVYPLDKLVDWEARNTVNSTKDYRGG